MPMRASKKEERQGSVQYFDNSPFTSSQSLGTERNGLTDDQILETTQEI